MVKIGKKWEIPIFSEAEGMRRWRKIRELMDIRHVDCLIIAGNLANYKAAAANTRYVSNWCLWFDQEYIVFPLYGEPSLFTWGAGHDYWAKKVSWIPIIKQASVRSRGYNYVGDIAGRIKELKLGKGTLGIVSIETMPANVYVGLKEELPYANFVSAGEILAECRAVKSPEELEFVRKAGECADKGFEAMLKVVQPGVTEGELVANCEKAILSAGGESCASIYLAASPWSERGHYVGAGAGCQRKLKKGDIILDEITPCYGGYYVQLVRPISIGTPPDDFMETYELHRDIYNMVCKELRPGKTIEGIEGKVKELCSQRGDFSRVSCLQHIGVRAERISPLHEIKAGMVFVNHAWTAPSSKPEQQGHTIGDTLIVTEGEPERVSKLPFELEVV